MTNGKLINIAMYVEYSTFEKQGVGVQPFPGKDTGEAPEASGF